MQTTAIRTCLWYESAAEEAVNFYVGLVPGSAITHVNRQMMPDGSPGAAFKLDFTLMGQAFAAMNGGPRYRLNEAASIMLFCQTQAEIDRYWEALTANGGSESRCGWLKDRWGLSWQILPSELSQILGNPDRAAAGRAMEAMMQMNKFDLAAIKAAAAG